MAHMPTRLLERKRFMNVVFISPQFPDTYWHWCDRLRKNGATVLGVGDTPYDNLADDVRRSLDEYYWVSSLEDYDQVFRAVAYFSHKYGKIDWLESNNEYWLSQDARLRDDFHITTGAGAKQMALWQSKASMKSLYAAGGIPTARQVRGEDPDTVRAFARDVGFPVFTKPERGVGAGGARKIVDEAALEELLAADLGEPYVLEEYVDAELCSYEAIVDANGDPLFENQSEFPPSIAETVELQLDVAYHTCPDVDPKLRTIGRATTKAFGIKSRFVHMEFFRLTDDKPGLGSKGDYVGLEVNVRAPGGYTPDMINFAHSVDVYQIWADMVTKGTTSRAAGGDSYYCIYASRRDCHTYAYTHDEIMGRYGTIICMQGRMAEVLSDDLGNDFYMARTKTAEERDRFVDFVQQQA